MNTRTEKYCNTGLKREIQATTSCSQGYFPQPSWLSRCLKLPLSHSLSLSLTHSLSLSLSHTHDLTHTLAHAWTRVHVHTNSNETASSAANSTTVSPITSPRSAGDALAHGEITVSVVRCVCAVWVRVSACV